MIDSLDQELERVTEVVRQGIRVLPKDIVKKLGRVLRYDKEVVQNHVFELALRPSHAYEDAHRASRRKESESVVSQRYERSCARILPVRHKGSSGPIWGFRSGAMSPILCPRSGTDVAAGTRETRTGSQRWGTFVRNHAQSIVASDSLVSITASVRVLYVLVVMEVGGRRILPSNVTAHPTAEWALQQFREAIPSEDAYRFLIRDRD